MEENRSGLSSLNRVWLGEVKVSVAFVTRLPADIGL